MPISNILLQLLRTARELNIARKLSRNLGFDAIGQELVSVFPTLGAVDLGTILQFGQSAFEAGRIIGRLEAGQQLPIESIPRNIHLPDDFLEGGRGVLDVHVQFANDPTGRDIQIIVSGDETIDDILRALEERAAELFQRYESFRMATVDDVRIELEDPGVLETVKFHGATRGF